MPSTRMFRDRVVSLEQTQELGEKYIDLLTELALEALPGYRLCEHGLDHEPDLYFLILEHPDTGARKRVAFTRMVLSDVGRLPAVALDRSAPVRTLFVACIRAQAGRGDVTVSIRDLLTPEERLEADEIEAEWLKKNEAVLAARRAEEERRERERNRQRQQQEEARQKAQREKREKQKSVPPAQAPGPPREGGRRRRRRGRGGKAPAGAPGASPRAGPPLPQPRDGERTSDQIPVHPEGGGRRRRRRRGRGGEAKPPSPRTDPG